MSLNLTDERGYAAHADIVTGAAFRLLVANGEITSRELSAELFRLGIGDARSDDRYELSWSRTGAIARAAVNHLRGRGFVAYVDTPTSTTLMVRGEVCRALRVTLVLTQAGRNFAAQRRRELA